jgi:hypothetical protein
MLTGFIVVILTFKRNVTKCRARLECNRLCSRLAATRHCAPPPPPPTTQLMLKSIHTSLLRWREAQFNLLFCLLAVYFSFALCAALTCHFIPRKKPQICTENGCFIFDVSILLKQRGEV